MLIFRSSPSVSEQMIIYFANTTQQKKTIANRVPQSCTFGDARDSINKDLYSKADASESNSLGWNEGSATSTSRTQVPEKTQTHLAGWLQRDCGGSMWLSRHGGRMQCHHAADDPLRERNSSVHLLGYLQAH
jgi:hypothetical protein